ncbi:c-type cytochrome [Methylomagnum sp.]
MSTCHPAGLPAALLLLLAACDPPKPPAPSLLGDAERGKIALRQHACPACHVIPGMVEATGRVGPPLDRWASRGYIAGRLPNTPDHLVDWLRQPQAIAPGSAMPDLGVTERDAWDMAAYLYRPD